MSGVAETRIDEQMLRTTIKLIEDNLDRWDQNFLAGTGPTGRCHCLAGWTIIAAGEDLMALLREHGHGAAFRRARTLLGFSEKQAQRLFAYLEDPRTGRHPTWFSYLARIRFMTGLPGL